jgi:hypothetical protein
LLPLSSRFACRPRERWPKMQAYAIRLGRGPGFKALQKLAKTSAPHRSDHAQDECSALASIAASNITQASPTACFRSPTTGLCRQRQDRRLTLPFLINDEND